MHFLRELVASDNKSDYLEAINLTRGTTIL